MGRPDAAERGRQGAAVAVVRTFVPVYGGLAALLFAPPLLRMLGLPSTTGLVQSVWSGGMLVALVVAAAWVINRLAGLGQYRVGAGLRFDFLAALLRGEYVATGGSDASATPAIESPLAVLRADVTELQPTLLTTGELALAETVVAGLHEAESIARLIEIHEGNPVGLPIAAARAAVGRYTDHVLALRAELLRGGAVGAQTSGGFQADLVELRAIGDTLRRGPSRSEGAG